MLLSTESARLGPAPFRFAPRGVRFDSWEDDPSFDNPDSGAPTPVDTSFGGDNTDTTSTAPVDTSGSMWGDSGSSNPWGDTSGGSAPAPVDQGDGSGGGGLSIPGGNTYGATGTSGWYNTNTGQMGGGSQDNPLNLTTNSPGDIGSMNYLGQPLHNGLTAQQAFNAGVSDPAYGFFLGQGAFQDQLSQNPGQMGAPTPMGMGAAHGPTSFTPVPPVPPVFHAAMLPGLTGTDTGVPTSQNGQSLFDQDPQTQQLFQGTYGDQAAAEWARENDANLSASLPQGAQLPADALPDRNDQTTVPGPRPAVNSGTGQGQPPNFAGAPTPTAPGQTPPGQTPPGAGGTHQVVTPDGKVLNLSDEGYAGYEKGLEAMNTQLNADRTYKQGQDALANQRADKQLDIERIRDAGNNAYQQALAASRSQEVANQAAYQAAQTELERQRVEMQNQGNMQTAAYQQAALSQTARTEANRTNQQREATDLQRRLLPTTRLARRGTTVQIT